MRPRAAAGAALAVLSDRFGARAVEPTAPAAGIVVGRAHLPIVNEADAPLHLAALPGDAGAVAAAIEIPDADGLL